MEFLIINGPNLNLLGKREPDIYGSQSLKDLEIMIRTHFSNRPEHSFDFIQSNHEGVLIEAIHGLLDKNNAGLVINAGAYTHTSVALRDAISGVKKPTIEVHISNVYAREEFRSHSYLSPVVQGVICGLGFYGYIAAIEALIYSKLRG